MAVAIYVPKNPGNPQTNYLRIGPVRSSQEEALASKEAKAWGAVVVSGERSSLEPELPLPALNELAGREVKQPFSCGCYDLASCRHRGDDGGFGLVPERPRNLSTPGALR